MPGLRERKKQATAQRIAMAAAQLFADHGYEAVSVSEVAAAAEVSEQTVYNYFPTKEDLVFDRSDEIGDALVAAVAARPVGTTAADAVAAVAQTLLDRTATLSLERLRGGMPNLAISSVALRRAGLDRTRTQAHALAEVLVQQGEPPAEGAIVGWALAGAFQLLIEEMGQAQRDGEDPTVTAGRLAALVARRLHRLRLLEER